MLSIADALERIKGRVTDAVPEELIRRLALEAGHRWRDRDLGPVVTTHLFLQQVLHGNTAVAHLRRLSGLDFTDAAYCQARARLPLELLRRLQDAVTDGLRQDGDERPEARWLGHRVFLLDGPSFSRPDTPELREHFGQPSGQAEDCGFPVAHLMALFDARRGYLLRAMAQPLYTRDMSQAAAGTPSCRGRRAGGRPGVRLLRPPGVVPGAGPSRPVPRSPAADRQLPPGPPARRQGAADVTLAEAAGEARPAGGVLQAQGAAGVDDGPAVRGPGCVDRGA